MFKRSAELRTILQRLHPEERKVIGSLIMGERRRLKHGRFLTADFDLGDQILKVEALPEPVDMGRVSKRANPDRLKLWAREQYGHKWQLVHLKNSGKVCLAFYGGAHRCFYDFTSKQDLKELVDATKVAAKLLRRKRD